MPASSPRDRLPFEPKTPKKKKLEKIAPAVAVAPGKSSPAPSRPTNPAQTGRIPEVVGTRMIRRMAIFSGIPTGIGLFSFVVFYWVVSHDWLEIPTYVVFGVSLLLLGLGVVGLSYGIFSTEWDEQEEGSWWGWQQFRLNLGRMNSAWRGARQEAREAKEN